MHLLKCTLAIFNNILSGYYCSASGKTSTAKTIQNHYPRGTVMRISKDEIRLGILNEKNNVDNSTSELIKQTTEFGKEKFKIIVFEGILGSHIY